MRAFYAVACVCILSVAVDGIRLPKTSSSVGWFGEQTSSLAKALNIRGGAGWLYALLLLLLDSLLQQGAYYPLPLLFRSGMGIPYCIQTV